MAIDFVQRPVVDTAPPTLFVQPLDWAVLSHPTSDPTREPETGLGSAELLEEYRSQLAAVSTLQSWGPDGPSMDRIQEDTGHWFVATGQAGHDAHDRVVNLFDYLSTHHGLTINLLELKATTTLIDALKASRRERYQGLSGADIAAELDGQDIATIMPAFRYLSPGLRKEAVLGLGVSHFVREFSEETEVAQHHHGLRRLFRFLGDLKNILQRPRSLDNELRIGSAVLGAAVEVSAIASEAQEARSRERLVTLLDGRKMKLVSYFDGDPAYEELTEQMVDGRQREYARHGLLEPDAKKDNLRGPNVEFIALLDPETGKLMASLRKVHARGVEEIKRLPTYEKAEADGAFDTEGLRSFQEHIAMRDADEVHASELVALWKDPDASHEEVVVLYSEAVESELRVDGLVFMGAHTKQLERLQSAFGHEVVRVIGLPMEVKGEGAKDDVRLFAAFIEPRTAFDDLMDGIDAAKARGDTRAALVREVVLGMLMNHFDLQLLSDPTRDRLLSRRQQVS